MRTRPLSHRLGAAALASTFAFVTLAGSPRVASADEVSPNGKGVTGGALLGAEVITIVESMANVHQVWAYGVGAAVGAIGGGVGGYFVEQNSSDGRVPVYMLAGGVGLIIPALVLTLNATRYQPSNYVTEDNAPTNGPAANPGVVGGSSVAPTTLAPPTPPAQTAPQYAPPAGAAPMPAPTPSQVPQPTTVPPSGTAPPGGGGAPPLSLLDVNQGSMRLGVPVPEVRPVFSASELRQYGLAQQTEVRMPLVKIVF